MLFGIVGADNGAAAGVVGNAAQDVVAAKANRAERSGIDDVDGDVAAIGGLDGVLVAWIVGAAGSRRRGGYGAV